MKSFLIVIVVLLSLNTASFSQSGFIGSFGGGISAPTGMLSDDNLTGFNLHGSSGYIFNKNIGARLDFQYNSFGFDNTGFPDASGGTLSIVSIKTDLLAGNFDRSSRLNPYGVLGFGYFMSNRSDLTVGGFRYIFESSNDFGMGLGGGTMFNISRSAAVFGEGQLNIIFTPNENITYVPFRAGIIFRP
ncbi:MAG: outer membrane beta-barrel protein [Ignavibacteria bacterium]